jgi:hypothetical protein
MFRRFAPLVAPLFRPNFAFNFASAIPRAGVVARSFTHFRATNFVAPTLLGFGTYT